MAIALLELLVCMLIPLAAICIYWGPLLLPDLMGDDQGDED